ncbi:MAG: molybdenum cofactor guanylyltransferase [bacterium]|nr:molybdenum cofactor guanylyltransferase [bacterium]
MRAAVGGVVLCGGESRRMGADKAALRFAPGAPDAPAGSDRTQDTSTGSAETAPTWGERACRLLEGCGLPVVLSIRADRHAEYAQRFPERTLVVDDDPNVPGPLGALLSVYRATRRSLFVLAVDMPFMHADTVRLLLDRFVQNQQAFPDGAGERYGGVCFGDGQRIDPLCAVYAAEALAVLEARAAGLKRYDLQQLRTLLNLEVLTPAETERARLRNLNSPEDLRAAGGAGIV